jgi:hypothetical protein
LTSKKTARDLNYLQEMDVTSPASQPIACNPTAISATDRRAYTDLLQRLRAAVREREELAGGYTFLLNGHVISLADTARWITWERLCCPFLTFEIRVAGDDEDYWLTLSGPAGTRQIIEQALTKV